MSLLPSGVALPPDLASTMSQFGTGASNQIGQNYGNATASSAADNQARGQQGSGPGSYATQRLGTQQGLDLGNLETGLGNQLGNTAYQNSLNNTQYQQQMELANEYGKAMAPSTLEQIMGGIGIGAKAVTPWLGMMGGSSSGTQGTTGSMPSATSLIPGGGASQYMDEYGNQIPSFGYGQTYPNMMNMGGN